MVGVRQQSRMTRRNTALPDPSCRHTRDLFHVSQSLMRLGSAAFVGLFLAIGFARPVDAQEEEIYCGMCVTEDEGATHWAQNSWMPKGWFGAVDEKGASETGFHITKNLPKSCKEVHEDCPGTVFAELTDAAIDAATRSDVAALARLVNDPAVSIFAARNAIHSLSAQDTITVAGDDLICSDCVIALDTIVTIGGLDGPGMDVIQQSSKVAVDRQGRILVYWSRVPRISVFDSTGVFMRTIGGAGEGPGEYAVIVHVDAGPRYLHVFDMRRRTLLDYEYAPVRVDNLPAQVSYSHVTESDDIVFAADLRTREAVGHPLHILTPSGELSSHGGRRRVYRGPTSDGLQSLSGADGRLWVAPVYPNSLVEWDWSVPGEPTIRRVIDRVVEEFDRHDPERWPGPRNAGIMLDRHGLWMVWRAPDPDWDPDKFQNPADEPRETTVDSWVDLVDPSSGRTIARRRIEGGYLKGFAGSSPYVVAYEESEAGVPYLHLTKLVLRRVAR